MKPLSIILFIILTACGASEKNKLPIENSAVAIEEDVTIIDDTGQGTIIASVRLQNIPYRMFYFKINQILLVNSITNQTIALTAPNNPIGIDHSYGSEYSEILTINQKVPSGLYDRAIIIISLDNSFILHANQSDKEFQLVDVALNKIPQDKSDFTIESYIRNNDAVLVEDDSVNKLEFLFDIEASTKHVPLPSGSLGIMFNPQVIISTKPSNNKVRLHGLINEITNDHVNVLHFHKVQSQSPERQLNYAYKTTGQNIFFNGLREENIRYDMKNIWSIIYAEILDSADGFTLDIDKIFMVDKNSRLKFFHGYVIETSEKQLVISGFSKAAGYSDTPIFRKIVNRTVTIDGETLIYNQGNLNISSSDIKITPGQPVIMTLQDTDGNFRAHSIYIEPSRILAEIDDVDDSEGSVIIKPLSYNNTDRLSSNYNKMFDDELSLKNRKNDYVMGQLINTTGYLLQGNTHDFFSLSEDLIPESTELDLNISIPTAPVFSSIAIADNQSLSLTINHAIYKNKALIKIRYPDSNAQYRSVNDILKILIDIEKNEKPLLSVLIDGTDPVQSLNFDNTQEFYEFIQPMINNTKFFFNEVNVTGVITDDVINASKVSLVIVDNDSKTVNYPPDDNDESSSSFPALSSKTKNILAVALPILVPIGVTLGITLIVSTITNFIDSIYSSVKFTVRSKHIKNEIIKNRTHEINKLIAIINANNSDGAVIATKYSDLKDVSDAQKFEVIKSQLSKNIAQLKLLRENTHNDSIDKIIRLHNFLETYIQGFEDTQALTDKIKTANQAYIQLIDASQELEDSLLRYINSSLLETNRKHIASSIDKYTNNINDIFIKESTGRLLDPNTIHNDLNKKNFDQLKIEINKVRNIKLRF